MLERCGAPQLFPPSISGTAMFTHHTRTIVHLLFAALVVAIFHARIPFARAMPDNNHASAGGGIPDSVAIQSAARVGDRVLAVWGTTLGPAPARPVLMGQIIWAGNALGAPFLISERAARPASRLRVLALRDRFLVIWEDHRNAPRLDVWICSMDVHGNTGPEQVLGNDFSFEHSTIVKVTGGSLLLWESQGGAMMQQRLDQVGRLVGGATLSRLPNIGNFLVLPDPRGSIISLSNNTVLLLDSTETFQPAPVMNVIPAGAFVAISHTGRIAYLTSWLSGGVYDSPYDTVPARTFTIPTDSVPEPHGPSTLIQWDMAERLRVCYLSVWDGSGQFRGKNRWTYTLFLTTLTEKAQGRFSYVTNHYIDEAYNDPDAGYERHASISFFALERPCLMTTVMKLKLRITESEEYRRGGRPWDTSYTVARELYITPQAAPGTEAQCGWESAMPPGIPIGRVPREDSSAVVVYVGGVALTLVAPMVPQTAAVDAVYVPASEQGIRIAPNPVRGSAAIVFNRPVGPGARLVLADSRGNVVLQAALEPGARDANITVADVPSGVYLAVLEEGGSRWVARCIVAR